MVFLYIMMNNEIINLLTITDISSEGKGVGRVDGMIVFVKDAMPGDIIKARVVRKKKKFLEAIIEEFFEKSIERTDSFCEHFGLCGGCKWQHMQYDAQLRYKQRHVENTLRKISGVSQPKTIPILGSKKTKFYRNKLEFTFSNFRWLTKKEIDSNKDHVRTGLGFHIPKRFDKILNINKCFFQTDPSNDIRLAVKDCADQHNISFFDVKKQRGLLRNFTIRTSNLGDIMVILHVLYQDKESIDLILNFLKKKFPQISSLMFVVNEKKNDSISNLKVELFSGKDYIMEQMGDLKFKIGPKSFYQTNSDQAYELYKKIAHFLDLKGDELVYDLYAGIGTITNFIAQSASKVIGIECIEEAIEDAKINSEINGITNTTFYVGDMKDLLNNTFIDQHGKPDAIITDPPRVGMHPKVTQLLTDLKVNKIVYVSCNPATQARDLEVLGQTYDVIKIQPIDMFPHTHHVENVALLHLRE